MKKRMPRRRFLEFKKANRKGWIADDFPLWQYGELTEETERCRDREIVLMEENRILKKMIMEIAEVIGGQTIDDTRAAIQKLENGEF